MASRALSSPLGKILSILLALITISSIGAFAYNIASPPVSERFTEFYILNSEGKAADYPASLTLGQSASVIIGIVNREQTAATYRVTASANQTELSATGLITLEQGATHEEKLTFQPVTAGANQKIEFLLYKSGQEEAYRSVYLLISVK